MLVQDREPITAEESLNHAKISKGQAHDHIPSGELGCELWDLWHPASTELLWEQECELEATVPTHTGASTVVVCVEHTIFC